MGMSADGSTTVEWEVTECIDDGSEADQPSGTKRKIEEAEEKDVTMRGN
jgi:hypothetical protein